MQDDSAMASKGASPQSRYRMSTSRAIAAYLALIAILLGSTSLLYSKASNPRPRFSTAWYQAHAGDYNLMFIGDSRTYNGIHAEMLDPLLGSSTINLSGFANWFPTQVPMVQDFAPLIPHGTTVVWSIGTQNFRETHDIYRIYPIGIANALRFISWGSASTDLLDNIAYFNPVLHFFTRRGNLRQGVLNFLDRPLKADFAAERERNDASLGSSHNADIDALMQSYRRDPNVTSVEAITDDGKITSLGVMFRRGSYLRVELDHAYFRRKQREMGATLAAITPEADTASWRMFEEILRIFKQNGVMLIVNELEEAPFMYGSSEHREKFRRFMRDTVAKRVREEGFTYIRIDLDQLGDDDYFDWDHLNDKGAKTFIPLMADALRPHLHKN
jgi:hypothetical protein